MLKLCSITATDDKDFYTSQCVNAYQIPGIVVRLHPCSGNSQQICNRSIYEEQVIIKLTPDKKAC